MTLRELPAARLRQQQIVAPGCRGVGELVARLGAVQAQDYAGALWALGLRLPGTTEVEIERAIAQREVVRTWPMRGTLHFVAAADVRWMLALLTPRVVAGAATRRAQLELDDRVFAKCRRVFAKALRGGGCETREALLALLEKERVSTGSQRGYHILWMLSQEGTLCFGPRAGKQHTFVLLEEWLPAIAALEREAALAALARRYFIGHGPATVADFAWWSGLKISEARAALDSASKGLVREKVEGVDYWLAPDFTPSAGATGVQLLPGFDEYLLGYKDRAAVLAPEHAAKIVPGANGMFLPTILSEGRVVGTWKRIAKRKGIVVTPSPFGALKKREVGALRKAAEGYGKFMGLPAEVG
jgi:hypothetical protein